MASLQCFETWSVQYERSNGMLAYYIAVQHLYPFSMPSGGRVLAVFQCSAAEPGRLCLASLFMKRGRSHDCTQAFLVLADRIRVLQQDRFLRPFVLVHQLDLFRVHAQKDAQLCLYGRSGVRRTAGHPQLVSAEKSHAEFSARRHKPSG